MLTEAKKQPHNIDAVDFMRKVREKMTEAYYQDKGQYLKDLQQSMESFKKQQQQSR